MLYELSQLLDINLLGYISVRAGFAFFIAFLLTIIIMPKYLAWAISKNANQPISKYVPAHESKRHTPTMGGAIFLVATVIATLISTDLSNLYIIGGLITIIGFGLVGFQDDIGKVLAGDNLEGLTPKGKILLQSIIAAISTAILLYAGFPTEFYVPFLKTPLFDLGYLAIPFWVLVFLATTNAVNLTDGLDGLATVPSIIALFTLGAIIYVTGHAVFSQYLLVPNINGVGEVMILASALSGALLGFLWYNCYPAEVFMGDTGSLAIGGFIAYLAILGKSEVLLILIGLIFVIETVSVILQVGSFKLREKRIFKMAPIHHHFELKGWAENKIIVRFWMISFIANILALISFKFR
ncbi:MAG: Phospho-N-acetylmuramoyl-pentapeptide-transferase (EC [uncultured Sulfurovum sp.]|uniref:Phospho-N-acetylmuramoyl-pentapeptide-transferase n=1 Tax=uncultured Sulfurovum sp. TaxID=269237 RepID=A0A6S6TM09_9BACT|nr:MAG: Phospho-N-acetylmuramoyl-pentapeptide-transferase (EC [uncultured Sulfurovum sp.]